jgi:putative transposase
MSDEKTMGQVIQIDEARIRDHLGEARDRRKTLNAMLDAEADRLCGAGLVAMNERCTRRLATSAEAWVRAPQSIYPRPAGSGVPGRHCCPERGQ